MFAIELALASPKLVNIYRMIRMVLTINISDRNRHRGINVNLNRWDSLILNQAMYQIAHLLGTTYREGRDE